MVNSFPSGGNREDYQNCSVLVGSFDP